MDTKETKNTDKTPSKEIPTKEVLEITGVPTKDLAIFNKSKNYEFGIKILEYYVPNNLNLIEYFKSTSDMNYLKFNLKVIIDARC